MILLLGGTSETLPIASELSARGFRVLVSTATGFPLEGVVPSGVQTRIGPLSASGMIRLIKEMNIRALVDATHPYALEASEISRRASRETEVPCFRFLRPGSAWEFDDVHIAADHGDAARMAFSFGKPVLLTTGSRNLAPYAARAVETGLPLVVRVLPADASVSSCLSAGIPRENILTGKGPFSRDENVQAIRRFNIGALVTKDSGDAGGTLEKLEAARATGCEIVVVRRPQEEKDRRTFEDIAALADAVAGALKREQS